MFKELTISEAVSDPLIALMNHADNVSNREFAQMLESAARVLLKQPKPWLHDDLGHLGGTCPNNARSTSRRKAGNISLSSDLSPMSVSPDAAPSA